MSEELAAIIRQEIQERGSISFSRWMELCLYHPRHGYYMKPGRKTGYGRDADFVTPPTLHPFVGHAVGKELLETWNALGKPAPFHVAEYGGGEGGLARGALDWADRHSPGFGQSLRWHHVEANPARLEPRDERISVLAPEDYIEDEVVFGGMTLQSHGIEPHGLVACEVLDAIPFDVIECAATPEEAPPNGKWLEVRVDSRGLSFTERLVPCNDKTPPDELTSSKRIEKGHRIVTPSAAQLWLESVLAPASLQRAILIDYGGQGPRGGARAYSRQALTDPLSGPGDADITGSVDFGLVGRFLEGWKGHLETLESFLLRHGILEELNRIDRSTVEGASAYLRLRQLLLPTGMGAAFKVQRFDRAPAQGGSP